MAQGYRFFLENKHGMRVFVARHAQRGGVTMRASRSAIRSSCLVVNPGALRLPDYSGLDSTTIPQTGVHTPWWKTDQVRADHSGAQEKKALQPERPFS